MDREERRRKKQSQEETVAGHNDQERDGVEEPGKFKSPRSPRRVLSCLRRVATARLAQSHHVPSTPSLPSRRPSFCPCSKAITARYPC